MKKEFRAKELKKESNPKVLGAVFLLLAWLILVLGIIINYAQTGGLHNDQVVNVLVAQLTMKFMTDFSMGFFTGIFAILGGYFLRQKATKIEQTKEPAQQ